ncbi:MAG: AMP-binding protein [Firmicutes bacterium]|nr:AMP-binding protein [Bacillota bacterium]
MNPAHRGYEGQLYLPYLMEHMLLHPDRPAITCLTSGRRLTYGELDRLSTQMENRFRDIGLRKNDVVMACLFNTWHFPVTMIAAWKTPAIFSPINFRLAPGEVALHIDDSKPAVLLWDSAVDATLAKALEMAHHRPQVLLTTGASQVADAQPLERYLQGAPEQDDQIEARLYATLDPFEDEILRHYTSGTTGQPKGTIETSAVLLQMDWSVIATDNLTAHDRMMNVTPWFHQGGIIGPTTMLALGAEIFGFPLGKFDPHDVLDLIARYQLTAVWGAPVNFDAMAAAQQERPREIASLRILHTMGSPFSRTQYERWSSVFPVTIINTYGTTESRMDLNLRSDVDPMEQKAGSAGLPAPFCRVRLVAIRPGERVEPDELVPQDGVTEGQVITQSPHQFLGYFGREALNAERLYKGWFYSGDVGTWDADGYITIKGRTDDMIQSGAEKVYPVPVEEALMHHPKVADCMVVGLPHPKWGEAVAAYVVPKEGEQLSVEELDAFCREDPYLADYTRPRYYCILHEPLPYNATGKKVHYLLRQRAAYGVDHFEPIPSERANALFLEKSPQELDTES